MSLALHYWNGRCTSLLNGPRLRNDLYCVELDVKLYYTIPYHWLMKVIIYWVKREQWLLWWTDIFLLLLVVYSRYTALGSHVARPLFCTTPGGPATAVDIVSTANDLGVILDGQLTMARHISAVRRAGFFQLRQLRSVTITITITVTPISDDRGDTGLSPGFHQL